jgi:hypothetical protein
MSTTTPPPSFLKFNANETDISNIKIGEIILSSPAPYNNSKINLSTNNFPITIPNFITLNTGTQSIVFDVKDNKRINILSVSYWGKNYASCPPSLFRINLLSNPSEKNISEISYEQNDINADKFQILFPSSLSTFGIAETTTNTRASCPKTTPAPTQQIAKIVIMYTESLKPTSITSTPNYEYFKSMIGIF